MGEGVLRGLCGVGKYRFGFHLPPYNSIDHVHLHCFLEPFSSFAKDKIVYGKMLTSVEDTVKKMA